MIGFFFNLAGRLVRNKLFRFGNETSAHCKFQRNPASPGAQKRGVVEVYQPRDCTRIALKRRKNKNTICLTLCSEQELIDIPAMRSRSLLRACTRIGGRVTCDRHSPNCESKCRGTEVRPARILHSEWHFESSYTALRSWQFETRGGRRVLVTFIAPRVFQVLRSSMEFPAART